MPYKPHMTTFSMEVLLGHEHGQLVLLLQLLNFGNQPADQDRRQAHRGLIHQENFGGGHEGAGDSQHLLLPTAHAAGQLASPLLQDWKGLEAEAQVLRHGLTCLRPVGTQ